MNEKVTNAAEQLIDAISDAVAEKILTGLRGTLIGDVTRRPLGPLYKLPKGPLAAKNGAKLLTNGNGKKRVRRGKPGAMTEAILDILKTAGANGLKSGDVRERVLKRIPKARAESVSVLLASLVQRKRIGSRGKRPNTVYFAVSAKQQKEAAA